MINPEDWGLLAKCWQKGGKGLVQHAFGGYIPFGWKGGPSGFSALGLTTKWVVLYYTIIIWLFNYLDDFLMLQTIAIGLQKALVRMARMELEFDRIVRTMGWRLLRRLGQRTQRRPTAQRIWFGAAQALTQ